MKVSASVTSLIGQTIQQVQGLNPVMVRPQARPNKTKASLKSTTSRTHPGYADKRRRKQQTHAAVNLKQHKKVIEQFKAVLATNIAFIFRNFQKKSKLALIVAMGSSDDELQKLVDMIALNKDLNKADEAILNQVLKSMQQIAKSFNQGQRGASDFLENMLFMMLLSAFNEISGQKGQLQSISRDDKLLEMLIMNGFHKKPLDAKTYETFAHHLNREYPTVEAMPKSYNQAAKQTIAMLLNVA